MRLICLVLSIVLVGFAWTSTGAISAQNPVVAELDDLRLSPMGLGMRVRSDPDEWSLVVKFPKTMKAVEIKQEYVDPLNKWLTSNGFTNGEFGEFQERMKDVVFVNFIVFPNDSSTGPLSIRDKLRSLGVHRDTTIHLLIPLW